MTKALVVYYSWSNGNTKRIALQLQEAIGADIERIETVAPYSGSYDDVVEQAHDEATADLLTQRIQLHEKTAWMLRSLLDS